MLMNLFAGLFHKRCPLCKEEVREQGNTAVHRFGKWYCSEMHADLYELELYEALRTVYLRHVQCHGGHAPLSEALAMDYSPNPHLELARLGRNRPRCLPHSSEAPA
jgi:hypothetical protein